MYITIIKSEFQRPGIYDEIFNSDAVQYGGSGQTNESEHFSIPKKWHGFGQHIKDKNSTIGNCNILKK